MTAEDVVIINGLQLTRNTCEILCEIQNDGPAMYLATIQMLHDHIVQQSNPDNELDTIERLLYVNLLRELIESLAIDPKASSKHSNVDESTATADTLAGIAERISENNGNAGIHLSTIQQLGDFLVLYANENPARIGKCMDWLLFLITLRKAILRAKGAGY